MRPALNIAHLPPKQIFLLNGAIDRETSCCSPEGGPMTAADMVQAAAGALAWKAACCRNFSLACSMAAVEQPQHVLQVRHPTGM